MNSLKKHGFTLVEIMIVVVILGIIASLAIPNYLKAGKKSQMQTCIANLKQLDSATEQVKFNGVPTVTMEMLIGADKYIRKMPVCPTEGKGYEKIDPPCCPTMPEEHSLDNM